MMKRKFAWFTVSLLPACLTLGSACTSGPGKGGGDGDGSGSGGNSGPFGDGDSDEISIPDPGGPQICGDGVSQEAEACDDGNTEAGDGCAADCFSIDPGFSCPQDGQTCRLIAKCGDGFVSSVERCDDGNLLEGDGCSPTCRLERSYKCEGQPSTCTETICGDSVVEVTESCDDGNRRPFDGCSSLCQGEPDCSSSGACTSKCGDGLAIGEECDDGNRDDGCSNSCTVEPGWTCENEADVSEVIVPVTYRDFRGHGDSAGPDDPGHPDFNPNAE